MEEFEHIIIPMDDAIENFRHHLDSHPRTILSAKFGDGKSFFLAEAEKQLQDSFTFLNIYPVNYQVANNEDIFEYIKRDILYQMYERGMVPENYELPDTIAAYFFICNNWREIIEGASSYVTLMPFSAVKFSLGAIKFFNDVKKKYDSFKKNGGAVGAKLDEFLDKTDKAAIYEEDPITLIIKDIVKSWRGSNPDKKVCLVFEDMDRIDPNHIFRILNLISAHIDYCYRYGRPPQGGNNQSNKFGVDRIVLCLDYNNLKKIFSHLYGTESDFTGYINKFCDRGVFRYSIREESQVYYIKQLSLVSGMDEKALLEIVKRVYTDKYNLRQLFHSIEDIDLQYSLPTVEDKINIHKGLFVIAAILKRLGILRDNIQTMFIETITQNPDLLMPYLAGFVYSHEDIDSSYGLSLDHKEGGYVVSYKVTSYASDGKANLKKSREGSYYGYTVVDVKKEVDEIVKCVYD